MFNLAVSWTGFSGITYAALHAYRMKIATYSMAKFRVPPCAPHRLDQKKVLTVQTKDCKCDTTSWYWADKARGLTSCRMCNRPYRSEPIGATV